jgi:hypothetical protein
LRTLRFVPLVLAATVALAFGGCNGDEETTTGARTETNGTETSRTPGPPPSRAQVREAQPDRPCRRVPPATLEQIEGDLKRRAEVRVAQAVRARQSFRRGLRRPYFVSAYVARKDRKLDVATWVVENLDGEGTLIPVDGLAVQASRGDDPTPWKEYGLNQKVKTFEQSRKCVQALQQGAVALRQREEE